MTNTTPFTFDELQDALDYVGLYDYEVRVGYSGRGMYGATCFGIVSDGNEASAALAMVKATASCNPDYDLEEILDAVCGITARQNRDNMAMQSIVYFPGWELPDPESADCELEDDREPTTTLEDALDEFGRLV